MVVYKWNEEEKKAIGLRTSRDMKLFWVSGKVSLKTIENLKNMGKNRKKKYGYINSPETRKKLSKIMKQKWKNGEITEKQKSTMFKRGFDKRRMITQKEGRKIVDKKGRLNMSIGQMRYLLEHPERIEKFKELRKKIILPMKDTTIEVKIQNFLKQLGYEFYTHQYINEIEHSYQCDIFIPSLNLVIECDGNHWHNYPTGTEIDNIRTSELISKGFKVLRLWESEIRKMTTEDLRLRIEI